MGCRGTLFVVLFRKKELQKANLIVLFRKKNYKKPYHPSCLGFEGWF